MLVISGATLRSATLFVLATALLAVSAPAGAAQGDTKWTARHDGGNGADTASALATGPDGTVYVTGQSSGGALTGFDYLTVAYDAQGKRLWESRFAGAGIGSDIPVAIAVSPDGLRVYVTGESAGATVDYVTIALDTEFGDVEWVARYDSVVDRPKAMALSPDGTRLYVTGESISTNYDYATVAYDTSDGTELWASRYNGPGNKTDSAQAVALSPDATTVYVTGYSNNALNTDYATIAYSAADGTQSWLSRYNGPSNSSDSANALAVSPDGTRVFVTGDSYRFGTGQDYTTISYDTSAGQERWVRRYHGSGSTGDVARAMAVSPDGSHVYVTGQSMSGFDNDYATVAYATDNGDEAWTARLEGTGNDVAVAVAVAPDGDRIYVAGQSPLNGTDADYVTVAYSASGAELWNAVYEGTAANDVDAARALTVADGGGRLYVTGVSRGDFATVVYDTGMCTQGNYLTEEGTLSAPVHDDVEPLLGPAGPVAHTLNCDVIATNGL